jgi:FkbM family methyltransferase
LTAVVPDFVARGLQAESDAWGVRWHPYGEIEDGGWPEPTCFLLYMGEIHRLGESLLKQLLSGWKLIHGDSAYALFYKGSARLRSLPKDNIGRHSALYYIHKLRRLDGERGLHRSRWGQLFNSGRSISNVLDIEEPIHMHFRVPPELRPGAVVVDVGAHIGGFALPAARMAQSGRVAAYEPNPASYELLRENIGLNGLLNVSTRRAAVAARRGSVRLHLALANPLLSNLLGPVDSDEAIEVPAVTIEDVLNEQGGRIDLLKMDIEGAEYGVLFPFGELLREKVDSLIVEAHATDQGDPASMRAFLRRLGFVTRLAGHRTRALILANRPGRKGIASPPPPLGFKLDWIFQPY